ncbi:hypothetical protein EI77_01832 [Prosthecobacter fusiformis]|uniref:Uncharacterized protein n=1 Tax=Prosthecobacter fusiformis TaxID=48464 RepID=A0A4R7S4K1_9BACT|nr:hypothetical protein EI77_01832 [Prosthecobacter fusiformis]
MSTQCPTAARSLTPTAAASLPCHFCGHPDTHQLDDLHICDECYIAKGSCCAGEDEAEATL